METEFEAKFYPAINCHYVRVRGEGNCVNKMLT